MWHISDIGTGVTVIINNNMEASVIGNLMKPSNKRYTSFVKIRRVGLEGKKKRILSLRNCRCYFTDGGKLI